MKKILVVLLSGLVILSFAACGKETDKDEQSGTTISSGSGLMSILWTKKVERLC